MSSYEQLNQIMKRKNFDSSENLWTELRKEIAIKQPNFDFEAHKAILLMCEASARNLQD